MLNHKRTHIISKAGVAFAIPALLLLLSAPLLAGVIHYPEDFTTLQAAMEACLAGDTVLIAPGIYTGPDNRGVEYTGPGITLLGQGEPAETIFNCTFGDHWIELRNCEGVTHFEGLKILQAGYAGSPTSAISCGYADMSMKDCEVMNCSNQTSQTAVGGYNSDFHIENVIFDNNKAAFGAAYANTVVIEGCSFNGHYYGDGSAVAVATMSTMSCDFEMRNCVVTDSYGSYGGAVKLQCMTSAVFENVIFRDNEAGYGGGAICVLTADELTIENCLFEDNYSYYIGGAIYTRGSYPREIDATVRNCVFLNNNADTSGGGGYLDESSNVLITGCTFYENGCGNSNSGGALTGVYRTWIENTLIAHTISGFGVSFGNPHVVAEVVCCNVFDNPFGHFRNIDDPLGTNGNFSLDPLFCGTLSENPLSLQSSSPCLPENNECGVLIGRYGLGCDTTATEATTISQVKSLYKE